MSEKKISIGFDRFIEIEWLDQIASWVAKDKPRNELHVLVDEYLSPFIKGETSLRKTKNVLFGVWVNANDKNKAYKAQAIQLLPSCSKQERLALHWGLAIASYPFFASVVRLIGRLLRLQDDIISKELVRRSVEQHGDTESIKRATARLLQSLSAWGVLTSESKSLFNSSNRILLDNSELVTWLMASILFSSDRDKLSIDDLYSDPACFPFEINPMSFQVAQSKSLEVVHQAVGNILVKLH